MSEPDGERSLLREALRYGLTSDEGVEARAALELAPGTEDDVLARSLVRALARESAARIRVDGSRRTDPRPVTSPAAVPAADPSFLGQLGTASDSQGLAVATLDNIATVLAVARAGNLRQRRAAFPRLAELLGEKWSKSEDAKRAIDFLSTVRDVEIAYELSAVRASLSGAIGKEVREERAQFEQIAARVAVDVARFWDGQGQEEPITSLLSIERALLLMRVRDLPDEVVAHLGALAEGGDELLDKNRRLDLLTSLRHAADRRLVAPLLAVLKGGDPSLSAEAARALGRVDDPRVQPALRTAYARSLSDRHRTVVAGALGVVGDTTGASYVRKTLGSDSPEVIRNALEALASVGTAEDSEVVAKLIEHADGSVQMQGLRTLGRIGDGRALAALDKLRDQTSVSAMWAELEDASAAIRARLELRGEEPRDTPAKALARPDADELALAPLRVRASSWKDYILGWVWLVIGAEERAVRRFEWAASGRPSWAAPHLSLAMVHAGESRYAAALASFRRAIEVDRRGVEQGSATMRALATCFLRRADEMEREGRSDIARGLLEEVMTLDLRRAPSAMRFEISRRHDAVRRRSTTV